MDSFSEYRFYSPLVEVDLHAEMHGVAVLFAAGAGFEIYQLPKLIKSRKQRLWRLVGRVAESDLKRG